MSFINQSFACEFLVKNQGKLEPKVYILSKEKDDEVARLQLEAMSIKIDSMIDEQKSIVSLGRKEYDFSVFYITSP